jgi:hypothetical protein
MVRGERKKAGDKLALRKRKVKGSCEEKGYGSWKGEYRS